MVLIGPGAGSKPGVLERCVKGALKSSIDAHAPSDKTRIGSGAKRIASQIGVESVDLAIERIHRFLESEEYDPDEFRIEIRIEPGSPWYQFQALALIQVNGLPEDYHFAVFRSTGALHRCINGEVQDPAIEV